MMSSSATSAAAFAAAMARAGHSSRCTPLLLRLREKARSTHGGFAARLRFSPPPPAPDGRTA
jgi:hypothetical protein